MSLIPARSIRKTIQLGTVTDAKQRPGSQIAADLKRYGNHRNSYAIVNLTA
jgi:hypothetical protein